MKDRILEFLKVENKSSAQFAEEIGVQPSGISHIISGRNNPSLDFVVKMLNKYPYLSTDWLIFGKGQMFREQHVNDLFSTISDETGSESGKPDKSESDNNYSAPVDNNYGIKHQAGSSNKSTRRIVILYDDNTFSEYLPGPR